MEKTQMGQVEKNEIQYNNSFPNGSKILIDGKISPGKWDDAVMLAKAIY